MPKHSVCGNRGAVQKKHTFLKDMSAKENIIFMGTQRPPNYPHPEYAPGGEKWS